MSCVGSRFIIFCLSTLLSISALSQDSQLGRFSVEFTKGCDPFTVQIIERENLGDSIVKQYRFEEGLPFSNDKSHVYQDTIGIFKIIQLTESLEIRSDTLTIEVLENVSPDFELFVCNNNQVQIEITDESYDSYTVFTRLDTMTLSQPNLVETLIFESPSQEIVSVQGRFSDPLISNNCKRLSQSINVVENFLRPSVSSIDVIDNCLDNVNMEVNFSRQRNTISFLEQSIGQNNFERIAEISDKSSVRINNISTEEGIICYQIKTIDQCTQTEQISDTTCLEFGDRSFKIENITATIESDSIILSWEELSNADLFDYLIERSIDDQPFEIVATVPDDQFKDFLISPENQYRYRITPLDTCKNEGTSSVGSPMILRSERISGNLHNLQWNDHMGWGNFTNSFWLQKLSHDGSVFDSEKVLSGKSINVEVKDSISNMRIMALSNDRGQLMAFSNIIRLERITNLFLPEAFTPNNDGLNDVYKIIGTKEINQKVDFKIFSRWGELLFYSNNILDGWDGNFNGEPAPDGTYVYQLRFPDSKNNWVVKTASFVLLRNK